MESFKQHLTEIKMSRVLHHMKATGYPVAMITAFRGDRSHTQNVANNKRLAATVRNFGFGYVWVEGAWIENQGTEDEMEVSETSLLVIGEEEEKIMGEAVRQARPNRPSLFELMTQEAKKWNQDAFMYKDSQGNIAFYDKQGKRQSPVMRSINLRKFEMGWTQLRSGNPKARVFSVSEARMPANWFTLQLIRDKTIRENNCL